MFDLSYFIGNSYFDNDGSQNHLIFQPMIEYLKLQLIFQLFQNGNLKI